MAKKAELLEKANELKLKVSEKNTIAEIEAAIGAASGPKPKQQVANSDITPDRAAEDAAQNAESAELVEVKDGNYTKNTAKAGKRSAKALVAADEKAKKEERKAEASNTEEIEKPKAQRPVTPTRSRLERRGKKFRKAAEQIDINKTYAVKEALDLTVKTSPTKFDATVEAHIRLNVDPKHADQNVRDTVVLPAGTGKSVRVAVFSDDKIAGADVSGLEALTKLLDKQKLDFDVLISTPGNMPKLGKYARILGPRGLMPNPKSGTVATDLAKAVTEAKAGRVEYRVDSTGIIHVGVGKVSFGADKLTENVAALLASVRSNKPASVKSNFVKAIHLATTMGPSISVITES